jgi:hypothetical protein
MRITGDEIDAFAVVVPIDAKGFSVGQFGFHDNCIGVMLDYKYKYN